MICLSPLILRAQPLPGESLSAGTLEIERNLSPFVRLLGTVVETESEDPIEGARITFGDRQMFSGEDGLFEVDPLLLGKYPLLVDMAGYEPYATVIYATPPMTTVKVVLHRQFKRSPWPGNDHPDRSQVLPERELVLNAPVPPPGMEKTPQTATRHQPVRPGKTGSIGQEQKAPGDRSDWEPESGPSRLTRVDVKRGFATLSGRVTEEKSGRPVAGAMVEVGPSMIKTDQDGRYQMENVPRTRFRVVFSRKGYLSRQQSVNIKAGGTVCNAILQRVGKILPPKRPVKPKRPAKEPAPVVDVISETPAKLVVDTPAPIPERTVPMGVKPVDSPAESREVTIVSAPTSTGEVQMESAPKQTAEVKHATAAASLTTGENLIVPTLITTTQDTGETMTHGTRESEVQH